MVLKRLISYLPILIYLFSSIPYTGDTTDTDYRRSSSNPYHTDVHTLGMGSQHRNHNNRGNKNMDRTDNLGNSNIDRKPNQHMYRCYTKEAHTHTLLNNSKNNRWMRIERTKAIVPNIPNTLRRYNLRDIPDHRQSPTFNPRRQPWNNVIRICQRFLNTATQNNPSSTHAVNDRLSHSNNGLTIWFRHVPFELSSLLVLPLGGLPKLSIEILMVFDPDLEDSLPWGVDEAQSFTLNLKVIVEVFISK